MPKKKRRANGEYSVFKNASSGNWRGQITIGVDEEGKYIRKSASGKTKEEVIEKLQAIDNEVKTGLYCDKSQVTVYILCTQMLDEDLNYNKIKEVTHQRYLETLKRMKPIYNIPLQQISGEMLKRFMFAQKDYSAEVIGKIYSLLKRVFDEAIRRKIITENPMVDVKKPKTTQIKKTVRALTEEEQKKLFDILITEDITYSQQMLISMLAGMRIGEINALQVNDVNFAFNTISIKRTMTRGRKGEAILGKEAKTDAGKRVLQMSHDVATILKDAIGDKKGNEMIFLQDGKLITTSQIYDQFIRVLRKYDILDETVEGCIDLHSLRHTFCTRCVEANMPPKVLQTILGHKNIKTTMDIYSSVFDKFQSDHIDNASKYLQSIGISIERPSDTSLTLEERKQA